MQYKGKWNQKWNLKRKWLQNQKKSWTLEEMLNRYNELLNMQEQLEKGEIPEALFSSEDNKIFSFFDMMSTFANHKRRKTETTLL